jgi:hypothetical protein
MRQIVRQRPDAGDERNDVCICIGERELDRLRRRRRLAPQDRRIHVQKSGDELSETLQRGPLDESRLKLHERLAEQPGLTLQQANERRQVAVPT